jgi:hypothetical protein
MWRRPGGQWKQFDTAVHVATLCQDGSMAIKKHDFAPTPATNALNDPTSDAQP